MAQRKAKPKPQKSLEQTLWEAADKLRGNQEPGEYKHVVLGLVFFKYISDRFGERDEDLEKELVAEGIKADRLPSFLESRDEYASHNVFWVPAEARWEHIQDRAKLPSLGQDIDQAMDLIEKENPSVRGVLPRNSLYDAIIQNDAAVLQLGDETLKKIATELVAAVRSSVRIDWDQKESVRASMRAKVRRLLAKYDYPPDAEAKAVELVLEQAERFAMNQAA